MRRERIAWRAMPKDGGTAPEGGGQEEGCSGHRHLFNLASSLLRCCRLSVDVRLNLRTYEYVPLALGVLAS